LVLASEASLLDSSPTASAARAIIAIGIVCWSVATFAGGLTSSFLFFLIARSVVGLGEAAYAPRLSP